MLTGPKMYILADVENGMQDIKTGDRTKNVTRAKVLVNTVELVGVNTAQLGQVQGFNLAFSVEIPRIQYDSEKYLYFDNTLYEIKTLSKAKTAVNMLLNVQKSNDNEAAKAIKEWIDANF